MPIQGFVRSRKHQFGRQSAFGDAEPATRAYPFSGTPDVNLNWTDPEGDFGSIAPIAAPIRGVPDIGAGLNAPVVYYNDLPLMLAGIFGGGVTPTGTTAKTWVWTPGWESPDAADVFTYEFGDDVTTDWFQLRDGLLTSLNFTSPEDRGALSAAMQWMFGHAASTGSTDSPVEGTVPTTGLSVDSNGAVVYAKDISLYIDSTIGGIGTTKIVDGLHTFGINITRELDQKRFVNGSQSDELDAYGVAGYGIEITCQFAKTADTVGTGSEADAWFSDTAVDRFVRFDAISKVEAETSTPYSWQTDLPMRYYTRSDGEIGGNTTVTLVGHAFVEAGTLDGFVKSTVVNTLADTGFES